MYVLIAKTKLRQIVVFCGEHKEKMKQLCDLLNKGVEYGENPYCGSDAKVKWQIIEVTNLTDKIIDDAIEKVKKIVAEAKLKQ